MDDRAVSLGTVRVQDLGGRPLRVLGMALSQQRPVSAKKYTHVQGGLEPVFFANSDYFAAVVWW